MTGYNADLRGLSSLTWDDKYDTYRRASILLGAGRGVTIALRVDESHRIFLMFRGDLIRY